MKPPAAEAITVGICVRIFYVCRTIGKAVSVPSPAFVVFDSWRDHAVEAPVEVGCIRVYNIRSGRGVSEGQQVVPVG